MIVGVLSPSGLSCVLGAADPAPVLDRNWALLAGRFGVALPATAALDAGAAPGAVQANFDALAGATGLALYPVADSLDPEAACQTNLEMLNALWGGYVPAALRLTTPPAVEATINEPFTFQITASGPVLGFDASGLPFWMGLAGDTLSGTPTAVGESTLTLRALGPDGSRPSASLRVSVVRPQPLRLTCATSAPGKVGQAFRFVITANRPAQDYGVEGGTLPAGLSRDGAVIAGAPTAEGVSAVSLRVYGTDGATASAPLTITVAPADGGGGGTGGGGTGGGGNPVHLTTPASVPARVGELFSQALTTSGSPVTAYGADGRPGWMNLADGTLSGTPDAAGTANLTLHVTGSDGSTESKALAVEVAPAPTGGGGGNPVHLTTPATARGYGGQVFRQTLTATGGVAGFSVDGLPGWLQLQNGVKLKGTPPMGTNGSTLNLVVHVAGTDGSNDTAALAVEITEAVALTCPSSASATAGQAFSFGITASGPVSGYRADALPGWLVLSGNTLSGTPPAAGSVDLTLHVDGSNGSSDAAPLSLTVAAAPTGGGGTGGGPPCQVPVWRKQSGGRGAVARVSASCATAGATIHVLDQAPSPDPNDWRPYSGTGEAVEWMESIYAYASAPGMTDSGVASFRNYESGYPPV